jgi:hypothetical protein
MDLRRIAGRKDLPRSLPIAGESNATHSRLVLAQGLYIHPHPSARRRDAKGRPTASHQKTYRADCTDCLALHGLDLSEGGRTVPEADFTVELAEVPTVFDSLTVPRQLE